jgi:hypothetical protein
LDCKRKKRLFLGPAKVCSVRWRARKDLEAEDHTGDLQGWVEDHVRASPSSSDPGLDVGGNRQEIRARVFPRRRAANRKANTVCRFTAPQHRASSCQSQRGAQNYHDDHCSLFLLCSSTKSKAKQTDHRPY